jgi:hypothetical protein
VSCNFRRVHIELYHKNDKENEDKKRIRDNFKKIKMAKGKNQYIVPIKDFGLIKIENEFLDLSAYPMPRNLKIDGAVHLGCSQLLPYIKIIVIHEY